VKFKDSHRRRADEVIVIVSQAMQSWHSQPFIEPVIDEDTEEEYKPLLFEGEESDLSEEED
jgi:hypothetical protein